MKKNNTDNSFQFYLNMIDLEKLNHYFEIFKGLTMQDLTEIFAHASLKKLDVSEYFIKQGEQKRQIAYIRKGLILCEAQRSGLQSYAASVSGSNPDAPKD